MSERPVRYALAFCGRDFLGLITEERPRETSYGLAYVGRHVVGGLRKMNGVTQVIYPGDRWSSKHPRVVAHLSIEDGARLERELIFLNEGI